MKIPNINPLIVSLHIAGIGTTVASVIGSYRFLLVETHDHSMSAAFAAGLGFVIFAGWEFAFNAERWSRRLVAALLAVSAASVSGYTVYQNNQHLARMIAIEQAQAQQAKADGATAQQRADLKTKRQALQLAIDDLKQRNNADITRIDGLPDTKTRAWQEAAIRKEISARDANIAETAAKIETVDSELIQLKASVVPVHSPTFNPASLLRATMFEGLTFVCLLFASWTSRDKRDRQAAQLITLESVSLKASADLAALEQALAKAGEAKQAAQTETLALNQASQQANELSHTISLKASADLAALEQALAKAGEAKQAAQTETLALNQASQQANELSHTLNNIVSIANNSVSDLSTANKDAIRTINNLHLQITETNAYRLASAPAHAGTDSLHIATELQDNNKKSALSKEELFLALKSKAINYNAEGRLTVSYIMEQSGLGRPSVSELLKKAAQEGYLISHGYGYTYAAYQVDSNVATANVVSLRSIK